MRRCLSLLGLLLCPLAHAATIWNVTPSSSLQTVINGAAVGDTIAFSAGTFNTGGLTLKCGITYTGPIATPATAKIVGTATITSVNFTINTGSGNTVPCPSNVTTIEYFNLNSAGGIHIVGPNANVVIAHNQFTGIPCREQGPNYTPRPATSGIFLDGQGGNLLVISAVTITQNSFGDSTSCISPNNAMALVAGSETFNGSCVGIQSFASLSNVTIQNNVIGPVSEGIHISCSGSCEPPSGYVEKNLIITKNDFPGIHRIAVEMQPQAFSGSSLTNNSIHDATAPYYGNFGLSLACCDTGATAPGITVSNNVIVQNTIPTGRYGYGIEAWGLGGIYSNNLIQSVAASQASPQAISWCYGMASGTITNNTAQGALYSGPHANGGDSYFGNENVNNPPCGLAGPWSPSVFSGNVESATVAAVPSATPSISPASGSESGPITVTLTDNGLTSGAQPLGNHSIYYTTNGSTPTISSTLYTGPFTVSSFPTTVKAIGMWGTGSNTATYPSGYGFVPSSVASATYSSGGGSPTVTSVTLSTAGSATSLPVGATNQAAAVCHYSDGSSDNCTVRSHAITWNSSTTGTATISSSGLITAVANGTTNLTATAGGFPSSNVPLTVSTLTSISISVTEP